MSESIGCGDSGCVFKVLAPGGMKTNGGCRCFKRLLVWNAIEDRWNRDEVRAVERDTQRLAQALRGAQAEVESLRDSLKRARGRIIELEDDLREAKR